MDNEKIRKINALAVRIREAIVFQLNCFGFGHLGGSMSVAELLACLYGNILRYDPQNPGWNERDRLVLSKGHCGPVLYAVLAISGFFPYEELRTLNKPHTRLPSHVDRTKTPGIDMTSGSLGQGISVALGMAHALKLTGNNSRVFAILGDGECQEGQVWEAALYAAQYKLSNFIGFIDANGEQFDRIIKDNIDLGDLAEKFRIFGWNAIDVPDGHDVSAILEAYEKTKGEKERPSVIILHTIKGKDYPPAARLETTHHIPVSDDCAKEAFEFYKQQLTRIENQGSAGGGTYEL